MKPPSAYTVGEAAGRLYRTISNIIQVLVFVTYTSIIDGFKKYVLTKDAFVVVLYSWIGIILRNYFYPQ